MIHRRTTGERRRMVNKAISMLVRGAPETLVRQQIMTEFGKGRQTAYLVVRAANKSINLRHVKHRAELVARQSAKLEAAQWEAMTGERVWIHWPEGADRPTIHREREVDVGSFVSAVAAQNKLLGLNAPEQRELILTSIGELIQDVHSLIREFLPDPEARQLFGARLRERAQTRLRERQRFALPEPEVVVHEGERH